MAHILIHHKVEDYSKWKPKFDEHASFRAASGSKGGKVYRSANDPNDLFVLLEWDNAENLQKFAQSDNLKDAIKDSGVVGRPGVHFIEEAAETNN